MVQKIDTILATGTLPIVQEKGLHIESKIGSRRTRKSSSQAVSRVLGFSAKSAAELERLHGTGTVSQLEAFIKERPGVIKLTKIQQVGLRHYRDLDVMIPRDEITQIGNKVEFILTGRKETDAVACRDDRGANTRCDIFVFLAGSYPSGLKKESKDIDILLVSRSASSGRTLMELVAKLQDSGIPLETISVGANKFLGLIKSGGDGDSDSYGTGKWRHLDMRLVDMCSFPYAWLYYASGVVFNKLIREKLKKQGYKLNEWGIFRNGKKIDLAGELELKELEIKIKDKNDLLEYATNIEKEIFKLAHLEYKTIIERY
jgi:DNA polymerase/3'-5' exonuclease PolX